MRKLISILATVAMAVSALAVPFATNAVTGPIPTTVVVTPANMNSWAFVNDQTDTPETGVFVVGPATPPLGVGSAQLTASTSPEGHILETAQYQGTEFSALTSLKYWTYQDVGNPSNATAIALQFNVEKDVTASTTAPYQGRIIYEPYLNNGGTVPLGTWNQWDALNGGNGKWWFSKAATVFGGNCTNALPCTMSQILALYPNIGIHRTLGAVVFKAGSGWTGFQGNVDALNIATSNADTTYDFDPNPTTSKVTIIKYVNGQPATASSTNSTSFPMHAVFPGGEGDYALGPNGFNNPNPYQATTSDMPIGSNYSTYETATSCTANYPYMLDGYSTGDTQAAAVAAPTSTTTPSFTNLQSDKFVIVRNKSCPATLTIVKKTMNGDGTFNYTVTPSSSSTPPSVPPLATVNGSATSAPISLDPGTYNVTEAAQSGWTLTGHSCVYNNQSVGQQIQNGEQITVDSGDSVTCTFTNDKDVHVTIVKYVDGQHATASSSNSSTFPFTATYNASNIGAGSDPFTIGPVGNGTPNAYEAMTIALASGANYSAAENTSGNNVVGATCADGKPFALVGYSSGDTLAQAQSATTTPTAPAFTGLTTDKYVIAQNQTCQPTPTTLKVHILKYLDGQKATSTSASGYQFPMTATWQTANLNGGATTTGAYVLGNNHGGAPDQYGADTAPMQSPAYYTTNEVTNGNGNVLPPGSQCQAGKYVLIGYSTSSVSFADAANQPISTTTPSFSGLNSDRYVIVRNMSCPTVNNNPPPANACNSQTPPPGYTLRYGTTGSDNVTLAPNTMFVGLGGTDKVTAGNGNYIICLGSGADYVNIGSGNYTIDGGDGTNTITTGNGDGTIMTGSGTDTITVGNGNHNINAGNGTNTVRTGDGNQTVTTGSGADYITTGNGNDTINAGNGNNTVKSGGGNDNITTGTGADYIDGGPGFDTCSPGSGSNTVVNCEA